MNEKKQSGYPQEDPREALERLMQDKPLKRPGGTALSGRNYWCKRVWQIFKEETLFTDGRYHSEAG